MTKKKKIAIFSIILSIVVVIVAVGLTIFFVLKNKENMAPPEPPTSIEPSTPETPSNPSTPEDPSKPETHTHTYGDWVVILDPTCTEPGIKERRCTAGDDVQTEQVSPTGHTPVIETDYVKHHIYCSKCNEETEKNNGGKHSWNDENKCTLCDLQLSVTDGLQFEMADDDTYELTGLGTLDGDVTEIIIPAVKDGVKVGHINSALGLGTEVDPVALENITTVVIPNNISTISANAFAGFSGLETVYLSNEITAIPNSAFVNCPKLRDINMPESLESIGENAFSGTSIRKVSFPATLQTIASRAFRNCMSLNHVDLPEDIVSIGDFAFQNCRNLNSIVLPKGLVDSIETADSIGTGCFNGTNLYEIVNLSDTTQLDERYLTPIFNESSIPNPGKSPIPKMLTVVGNLEDSNILNTADGFVFFLNTEEDKLYLVNYVGEDSIIVLPNSADLPGFDNRKYTIVGGGCFNSNQNLTCVTISGSVAEIQQFAFKDCTNLTSIVVEDGVEKIVAMALPNSVTDIFVRYDEDAMPDEWDFTNNNDELVVHYKDTWSLDADGNPVPNE